MTADGQRENFGRISSSQFHKKVDENRLLTYCTAKKDSSRKKAIKIGQNKH